MIIDDKITLVRDADYLDQYYATAVEGECSSLPPRAGVAGYA
jgi:hypothetical protein